MSTGFKLPVPKSGINLVLFIQVNIYGIAIVRVVKSIYISPSRRSDSTIRYGGEELRRINFVN